ncbi:MAG: YceI family protein [bacterium]|nr:YceI family protein [bacterium]
MTHFKKYLLLLCILLTTPSHAKMPPAWIIVPNSSEIIFTAKQNSASLIGTFKQFTGEIYVDPTDYKKSSINIVVDMNSLFSSYKELVTTLNSSDWFDVSTYPKAIFKSTHFNKLGNKAYQADGILTIRGKSVPVTLIFTAQEKPQDHAIIEGDTVISRLDFGIGQEDSASTDEIRNEVKIHFRVVAFRKK